MMFSPALKSSGGTGITFSYTPSLYCYKSDRADPCDYPNPTHSGAVLYLNQMNDPLQLLESGNAINDWNSTWALSADRGGNPVVQVTPNNGKWHPVVFESAAWSKPVLGVSGGSQPLFDKDGNLLVVERGGNIQTHEPTPSPNPPPIYDSYVKHRELPGISNGASGGMLQYP